MYVIADEINACNLDNYQSNDGCHTYGGRRAHAHGVRLYLMHCGEKFPKRLPK